MNTRGIFGLAGVGFLDSVTGDYIGFSAGATSLKISGGHEAKSQKNSLGVTMEIYQTVGDMSAEIEGINDATAEMIARLRGGKLVAGTDSLPSALKTSAIVSDDAWGATAITVANGKTPAVGAYQIVNTTAPTIRRLFTANAATHTGNSEGTIATTDFAVASVPSELAATAKGVFFVEPAATVETGGYVFGSQNLPQSVMVIAMSATAQGVSSDNVNFKRVVIPRMQVNPFDDVTQSNELATLGTVGGMLKHDPSLGGGIGGCYMVGYSYGAA